MARYHVASTRRATCRYPGAGSGAGLEHATPIASVPTPVAGTFLLHHDRVNCPPSCGSGVRPNRVRSVAVYPSLAGVSSDNLGLVVRGGTRRLQADKVINDAVGGASVVGRLKWLATVLFALFPAPEQSERMEAPSRSPFAANQSRPNDQPADAKMTPRPRQVDDLERHYRAHPGAPLVALGRDEARVGSAGVGPRIALGV